MSCGFTGSAFHRHGGLQRAAEDQDPRGSGPQTHSLVPASRRRSQDSDLPPGHVHRPQRGRLSRGPDLHQAEDQQPHVELRVHHGGPRRPQDRAISLPRRAHWLRRLRGQLHHPIRGHPAEQQQAL